MPAVVRLYKGVHPGHEARRRGRHHPHPLRGPGDDRMLHGVLAEHATTGLAHLPKPAGRLGARRHRDRDAPGDAGRTSSTCRPRACACSAAGGRAADLRRGIAYLLSADRYKIGRPLLRRTAARCARSDQKPCGEGSPPGHRHDRQHHAPWTRAQARSEAGHPRPRRGRRARHVLSSLYTEGVRDRSGCRWSWLRGPDLHLNAAPFGLYPRRGDRGWLGRRTSSSGRPANDARSATPTFFPRRAQRLRRSRGLGHSPTTTAAAVVLTGGRARSRGQRDGPSPARSVRPCRSALNDRLRYLYRGLYRQNERAYDACGQRRLRATGAGCVAPGRASRRIESRCRAKKRKTISARRSHGGVSSGRTRAPARWC